MKNILLSSQITTATIAPFSQKRKFPTITSGATFSPFDSSKFKVHASLGVCWCCEGAPAHTRNSCGYYSMPSIQDLSCRFDLGLLSDWQLTRLLTFINDAISGSRWHDKCYWSVLDIFMYCRSWDNVVVLDWFNHNKPGNHLLDVSWI